MSTSTQGGGVQTVRRVVTYTLLFVMVILAAIGLSGLLGRLLDAGSEVVADDSSALAQSLAFTLIAGPLAAALWWLVWRALADERDRSSVAWSLYLAVASTVALIVSAGALLSALAALIGGRWLAGEFATGLVWAGVWLWHRWMLRHPTRRPSRLGSVASVIGSFYGLTIGVGGAVTAFAGVLTAATDALGGAVSIGSPWWQPALMSLVWAAGGALIWWWFWFRDGVRGLHTGFARVVLVVITGLGAAALCLTGLALSVYVALRLAFVPDDSLVERFEPLGFAVSAALVGALVWNYHRGAVARQVAPVRRATMLVSSGVALAATASGVGVIVNALLAALGTPLAETGLRSLLLGGISALLVGGPVWWRFWRPLSQEDQRTTTGRRVYLLAVFGVSALVALITLILIAFRLFELGLTDVSGTSLLERVRAPFGLLTATLLVAGYHFALWRSDRREAGSVITAGPAIRQVTLVSSLEPEPLLGWIDDAIGASVTRWRRSDGVGHTVSATQLGAALDGLHARRVLVVLGPGERVDAIPLRD
ncbi:MAG TPA: DUF5671 domain-containing protein [Homoserinimonas sp.]|nr:DUF5671 domain-containing protein [Homoserinimonas sp.]